VSILLVGAPQILRILNQEETMQITAPHPATPDRSLEATIVCRSVDEVIHLVLAPGERVRAFCFAQRLFSESSVLLTTIVLAERQLLLIRPTTDGWYALDLAEALTGCSLVTATHREDGSALIAVSTPSGLLRLHVDASWVTQADLLEATLSRQPSGTTPEPTAMSAYEHAPADGISLDGDGLEFAQQFAGLVDAARDVEPDDFWINERT
jgi:hypothetical protein